MEDGREIFNPELLLLATLPLLFYVICQLFANGFLCHRKLVSLLLTRRVEYARKLWKVFFSVPSRLKVDYQNQYILFCSNAGVGN